MNTLISRSSLKTTRWVGIAVREMVVATTERTTGEATEATASIARSTTVTIVSTSLLSPRHLPLTSCLTILVARLASVDEGSSYLLRVAEAEREEETMDQGQVVSQAASTQVAQFSST